MKYHIVRGHKFTCEKCNATVVDEFHLEFHKEKYHESRLNPPAAAVGDKCDEVDSKPSLGKEQTRNSALFDEPMLTN